MTAVAGTLLSTQPNKHSGERKERKKKKKMIPKNNRGYVKMKSVGIVGSRRNDIDFEERTRTTVIVSRVKVF